MAKNQNEQTILTNRAGEVLARPERATFKTDWEFIRASHEFNDRVTNMANAAFDKVFRKALRNG